MKSVVYFVALSIGICASTVGAKEASTSSLPTFKSCEDLAKTFETIFATEKRLISTIELHATAYPTKENWNWYNKAQEAATENQALYVVISTNMGCEVNISPSTTSNPPFTTCEALKNRYESLLDYQEKKVAAARTRNEKIPSRASYLSLSQEEGTEKSIVLEFREQSTLNGCAYSQ